MDNYLTGPRHVGYNPLSILNELFGVQSANALFLGENAAIADKQAAAEAKRLHAQGATRDEIYKKTGWFNDSGVWNFETDDRNTGYLSDTVRRASSNVKTDPNQKYDAMVNHTAPQLAASLGYPAPPPDVIGAVPLSYAVPHNTLANAYPLPYGNAMFGVDYDQNPPHFASYFDRRKDMTTGKPLPGELSVWSNLVTAPPEASRRTLIHELQHAADDFSNRSIAYKPWATKENLSKGMNGQPPPPYFNRRSERRAFNAEHRRDWSPEQRSQVPPWMTEEEAVQNAKNNPPIPRQWPLPR